MRDEPDTMDGSSGRTPVAVVTGGTAGVGRATVRALAARGYDVGVLARGVEGLAGTAREIEAAGQRGCTVPTDVADADAVEAAATQIEEELGPVDVWVNNAMTTVFAPLVEISAAEYERATRVTYLGTVWGTMAALRRMRPRDRGTIVQVGSALAYRSIPLQAPYCGAKHAIRGFTDSLRSELIHEGSQIHLTMVQLPALNTPQFDWCKAKLPRSPQPVPPIFEPEVAADAIVFAAEHRRRELFVGLPTWKSVLGQKVIPGVLDSYLAHAAWEGQQTDQPLDEERPSNLFEPVAGDHGAHGRFDARARGWSPALEATERRRWLTGAAVLGGLGWLALRARGRGS
ncbi:MAG: SDR family oxidoreductase [Gemmatimonadota bacterium]